MSADQIADVLGTLATAGVVAVVALVGLWVVAPERLAVAAGRVSGSGTALAGAVAVVAMAGSLWFSRARTSRPASCAGTSASPCTPSRSCCPWRRWRSDRCHPPVRHPPGCHRPDRERVAQPHRDVPVAGQRRRCDPTNPCTLRWVEGLGVWTIPRMAAVAFALVLAALLLDRPAPEEP